MGRELALQVGVIAEKRPAISRWGGDIWKPVTVIPGGLPHEPGDILSEDSELTRYFMGNATISIYASDTEAYVYNFNSSEPALFVVLRKDEQGRGKLPYFLQDVTASPYLAQDYCDPAEDIVERITMPEEIKIAIMQFVDQHHVETPFKKRKRKDHRPEEHRFGKEPIFQQMQRHSDDG